MPDSLQLAFISIIHQQLRANATHRVRTPSLTSSGKQASIGQGTPRLCRAAPTVGLLRNTRKRTTPIAASSCDEYHH
jgi:hypothetical protein